MMSMTCACAGNVLVLFIRQMAQVDLVQVGRATIVIQSAFGAKHNFSSCHPHRLCGKSNYEIDKTLTYAAVDLTDTLPFNQVRAAGRVDTSEIGAWPSKVSTAKEMASRRWTMIDLAKGSTLSAGKDLPKNATDDIGRQNSNEKITVFSQTLHKDKTEAPILELNTESIDALNAKSLEENTYTRPETRLNKSQVSRNEFRSRCNSPSIGAIPAAKVVKSQDQMLSKRQMTQLSTAGYRHSHLTEQGPWQAQKAALKEKFKDGWNPRKKLSPDALVGIRAIHAQFPEQYTTSVLAEKFKVSPEAIRRILKSSWAPTEEEALDRQRRWFLRGQRVWNRYAELGLKPPAKWRQLGIGRSSKLAANIRKQLETGPSITLRGSDYTAQDSDVQTNMAERIL